MGVPVTLTIDAGLLQQAEALGLDLNELTEQAVRDRLGRAQEVQEYYEKNKDAIDSYNAHLEKHGPAGRDRGLRRL